MTATAPDVELITEPGVYDLPVDVYHRDPVLGGSLSSTGTKKLLPPSCPALFRHWRTGPPEEKRTFDFGRAAHRAVLGAGDDVEVVEGSGPNHEWRTDAAKERVKAVREAGRTPIKPQDAEQIDAMADALRRHEVASALLAPGTGKPEQTLAWQDGETGVWRRALLDWLPHPVAEGRRMIVPDYKTAARVDPDSISKTLADLAYHVQARYYLDAAQAVGGAGRIDPAFVLIMQAKEPPHLVVCAQVGVSSMSMAEVRIRHALHLYRWCTERDIWPGYADHEVIEVDVPPWARNQHDAAEEAGQFDTDIGAIYTPQLEMTMPSTGAVT